MINIFKSFLILSAILIVGCDDIDVERVDAVVISKAQELCSMNEGLAAVRGWQNQSSKQYRIFVECKNGALFQKTFK